MATLAICSPVKVSTLAKDRQSLRWVKANDPCNNYFVVPNESRGILMPPIVQYNIPIWDGQSLLRADQLTPFDIDTGVERYLRPLVRTDNVPRQQIDAVTTETWYRTR